MEACKRRQWLVVKAFSRLMSHHVLATRERHHVAGKVRGNFF